MTENKIQHIFFPYADTKIDEVLKNDTRYVYYTTAETAYRILRNKEIWMRSTMTMNDYFEVEHGFECLNAAYKSQIGILFRKILDECFPGIEDEILSSFNGWLPNIRQDTYITCFSEHQSNEDFHGRLSMWRAYGQRSGVAIVFKGKVNALENPASGLVVSPVAYWSQQDVENEFLKITDRINSNIEYVKSLGRDQIKNIVFHMFRISVLCTKHPGFAEEKEWRVFASPQMQASPMLAQSIEVLRGTPQTIQKLAFTNHTDHGISDFEIHDLLDRVIIGPCEFPATIYKAFLELLSEAGIPEGEKRIFISDIPLRLPQ